MLHLQELRRLLPRGTVRLISFSLLGSGSSGNAILVRSGNSKLLVDCGLSFRQLNLRAEELGESLDGLGGVFITHEHGDHVNGLGVLARKFARDREELARVALVLSELAITVHPRRRVWMLADTADNRVLECASAGRVDAVVTGDKKMLKLHSYGCFRIITIREFLKS